MRTTPRNIMQRPGLWRECPAVFIKPLKAIQTVIADAWFESLFRRDAGWYTVQLPRQYGKNEVKATCEVHALWFFGSGAGGDLICSAPTYKPQTIISMERIDKISCVDPRTRGGVKASHGFKRSYKKATATYLSCDNAASIVGHTADIVIHVDEAHKFEGPMLEKFNEDIVPMRSSSACPIWLWGVGAQKRDLLYRAKNGEDGRPGLLETHPERVFKWNCDELADGDDIYATAVDAERSRLGRDHPIFQTQYLLNDVDAIGGYFSERHIEKIFDSEHSQRSAVAGDEIYLGIDIAGGDELSSDESLRDTSPSRDSTIIMTARVNHDGSIMGIPRIEIIEVQWLTGWDLDRQQKHIARTVSETSPEVATIDSRGIGEQMAYSLGSAYGEIEPYAASGASVSEDCFTTMSYAHRGLIKMFRDDGSREYHEMLTQCKHAERVVRGDGKMNITKPSAALHIDMVKALQYIVRAVARRYDEMWDGGYE